jgi:hypothetical protein
LYWARKCSQLRELDSKGMLPSSPLLFDLLSPEVELLVNSQAVLNYSKKAKALKGVF